MARTTIRYDVKCAGCGMTRNIAVAAGTTYATAARNRRFCAACGTRRRSEKHSKPPTDRVWGKFRITHHGNGCWEWIGSRDHNGYGRLRHGKRLLLAHRIMWSVANCEEIPDGLDILHRCDNPPCVNPNHLYAGTHLQNMRDRDSRGRCHVRRGEQNGTAKFNADQVNEIRARTARGENQYALAAEYGVSQSAISSIHRRKTWRHV